MPEGDRPQLDQTQDSSGAPLISRRLDLDALRRLFDAFLKDDEQERRETFEALRRGLNEGRRKGYEMFP